MLLINFFKKASDIFSVPTNRFYLRLFFMPTMRISIALILLFSLNCERVFAQGPSNSDLTLISNSKDSLAFVTAETMLANAIKQNDKTKQGLANYLKGQAISSYSKIKALDFFNEASLLLEASTDGVLKDLYYEQSQIYTTFSDFPQALKYAFKSLEYNQSNNLQKKILRDMSHIGYIYDRMYDFKESIRWNRKGLQIAKNINDKQGEAYCYGRIGIAYDELAEQDNFNVKLFDSALYYNKKAVKLSEEINDLGFTRTTYSNIGNTYSKLKNYEKAEEYTLKSLNVPGFQDKKGVSLVNLGKIYLETNRYDEAKIILDSAMKNTIKYGTRKYQLEAYYRFHELDVKKGDYKSALTNYIEYKNIEDSLLNETKTRQIAEYGERFKSADKERQILIQRADLAEKNLTIQEKNLQVFGLLGLASVLALIGFLFYNQQKIKNKQLLKETELKDALVKIETQNRLQEQRLRISRDLHDNIGAQLTFIISSIDNLKYGFKIDDEKLNKKLESISDFTSGTIYELRDTIWAMNKSEITFEDLQSRISNYIDKAHVFEDKINFSFYVDDSVDTSNRFSSVQGMNIYRIIQEAINNALKYANAKNISLNFENLHQTLLIEIADDGQGFDINKIEKGNGLNNMQKRANDIGANIIVDSKVDIGTKVIIKLPVV